MEASDLSDTEFKVMNSKDAEQHEKKRHRNHKKRTSQK